MKTKELEAIIEEKYNKYNELLWYARKIPEDLSVPIIAKKIIEVLLDFLIRISYIVE